MATFEVTRPYNKEEGTVSGIEVALQHLFEGTPYGMQFNYTEISGGDVDVNCDNGWAGVNIIGVMRNVRQGTSIAQARHGLRARERGIEAGPVHYYNFTTIPHQDLIPFPNLRVF